MYVNDDTRMSLFKQESTAFSTSSLGEELGVKRKKAFGGDANSINGKPRVTKTRKPMFHLLSIFNSLKKVT